MVSPSGGQPSYRGSGCAALHPSSDTDSRGMSPMPVIQVSLVEGYDEAVKRRLCKRLSDAARTVIPAKPEATIVMVQDVPAAGYLRGLTPPKPAVAGRDGGEIVVDFLKALEARDLPKAQSFLAPDAAMTFPGGARFTRLDDLIAWAKPRYRFVTKTVDRIDVAGSDEGPVVYCFGTLAGEWPDGTAFSGIRYIDRFLLQDGLIREQDVWNDMGEVRPTPS